jgi:O-antigen/teichoic acid export membrane protein
MKMDSHLTKNSFWMLLSRFAAQGLAVVFTIVLARRLGSTGFGAYAFMAAILFVANALTTFGTDMLIIREIAARDDLSGLPIALAVQLVLSVVFIFIVWMFGGWIPNQSAETIRALQIYSLSLIPLSFFTVFTTALRGRQLMDLYMLLTVAISALQVSAVWLPEINLVALSIYLLVIQILVAIFAGLICTLAIPNFRRAWHLSSFPLSSFLRDAAPIAFLALLGMLYQRLNIYMLSTMTDAAQTGLFSAAARVVEASKSAHLAVFAALYPALAQSSGQGERLHGYFRFLLAGALLIAVSLAAFANPLVTLFYGNEFNLSADMLRILAWTLIPFTVNTWFTLSYLASKREGLVGRALAASLVGLLTLNLWWIPARGPEGGAWASLLAESLQSVILLASARSSIHVQGVAHEFSELSR